MTISAELQERYTTEVDVDWRHAFILTHPNATTKYIIDHTEEFVGDVYGTVQLFTPVTTIITLPARDDSGRSEMSLSWGNIYMQAMEFLEQAITDATKPINCWYNVFILGSPTPQLDPWMQFNLTDIIVTLEAVTATATRADIINQSFPTEVYRLDKFPGLRRR